jgi:hypothetical protein
MPSHAQTNAALSILRQNFRRLEVDLPPALVSDLEAVGTLGAYNPTASSADLADAVADALLAGKDPATDAKIKQLALEVQLARHDVAQQVRDQADARTAAAVIEHAPTVVATLVTLVAEADQVLADTRERIPNIEFTDDFLAGLPPMKMTAWGRAREAMERVLLAEQVWIVLANATGLAYYTQLQRVLIVADLSATDLDAFGRSRTSASDAIKAGHRLELATFEGLQQRVDRVLLEREQRQLAEERDFRRRAAGASR